MAKQKRRRPLRLSKREKFIMSSFSRTLAEEFFRLHERRIESKEFIKLKSILIGMIDKMSTEYGEEWAHNMLTQLDQI